MKDERTLTLEEQVEQNKQNIESQIALTNTNTTDIENLKALNDIDGVLVTDKTLGNLSDLNTDNKTTIVASINEVDSNVNAVEAVNDAQNNRLQIIENSLTTVGSDYSLLSAVGNVTDVVQTIKPTITKDFESTEIADNIINPTTTELTTKIFKASTVTANFWFNCQQVTGDNVRFTLKLWNNTTNTLIDEAVMQLDFAGSITINNPTRTVKGVVGAGDVISVRVQLDTGKVIQVLSSGMDLDVTAKQGSLNNIYDYQVISSGSLGNENVANDIETLNITKASTSSVADIKSDVDNLVGLNIETKLTDLQNSIDGLETITTGIHQIIYDMAFPVVDEPIIISKGNPSDSLTNGVIATWTQIGEMLDGQAIIGGSSSDGEIKSHDHYQFTTGAGTIAYDSLTTTERENTSPARYDSGTVGDDYSMVVQAKNARASVLPGSKTGGSKNKAYGLGIGTGYKIWKRTA